MGTLGGKGLKKHGSPQFSTLCTYIFMNIYNNL